MKAGRCGHAGGERQTAVALELWKCFQNSSSISIITFYSCFCQFGNREAVHPSKPSIINLTPFLRTEHKCLSHPPQSALPHPSPLNVGTNIWVVEKCRRGILSSPRKKPAPLRSKESPLHCPYKRQAAQESGITGQNLKVPPKKLIHQILNHNAIMNHSLDWGNHKPNVFKAWYAVGRENFRKVGPSWRK